MRVLCVGRHAFLSDHLCRYFRELETECEAVVGVTRVPSLAASFEPHVVLADADLLTATLLDAWAHEPSMRDVPVLAVSLTRRPEDGLLIEPWGVAGVIYLPGLERDEVLRLLNAARRRPQGVSTPIGHDWLAPHAAAPRL